MISKLFDLLTPHERVQALFIFVLMLGVALFEVIGVASIMPFIAVLVDPTIVETNRVLASTYEALGFENTQSFLFFMQLFVLLSWLQVAVTWVQSPVVTITFPAASSADHAC